MTEDSKYKKPKLSKILRKDVSKMSQIINLSLLQQKRGGQHHFVCVEIGLVERQIFNVWPIDIVQTPNGPSAHTALDSQNGPSGHSSCIPNGPSVHFSCIQNGPSVHLACVPACLSWGVILALDNFGWSEVMY